MRADDFRAGDQVMHASCGGMGAGTVERVDSCGVHVVFDVRSPVAPAVRVHAAEFLGDLLKKNVPAPKDLL